jgi:hypothetical protein
VIARVAQAVVRVIPSETRSAGAGTSATGFLINRDGYIATTKHAIAGVEDRAEVYFAGVSEPVWTEELITPEGPVDFALVRVSSIPPGTEPVELLPPQAWLPAGVEVAYLGHARLDLPELLRQPPPLIAARGMIGGLAAIPVGDGSHRPFYVLDGRASHGMSGGPVFCPERGTVMGAVIAPPPGAVGTPHTWAYAIPMATIEPIADVQLVPEEAA